MNKWRINKHMFPIYPLIKKTSFANRFSIIDAFIRETFRQCSCV